MARMVVLRSNCGLRPSFVFWRPGIWHIGELGLQRLPLLKPIEYRSECFPDQSPWCNMVSTCTLMDFLQQRFTLFARYTLHEYTDGNHTCKACCQQRRSPCFSLRCGQLLSCLQAVFHWGCSLLYLSSSQPRASWPPTWFWWVRIGGRDSGFWVDGWCSSWKKTPIGTSARVDPSFECTSAPKFLS